MLKKRMSLLLALLLAAALLLTGCSGSGGLTLSEMIEMAEALKAEYEESADSAYDDSLSGSWYDNSEYDAEPEILPSDGGTTLREDGEYSSKSEVGLYLYLYGKLPGNFITKKEAQKLGWVSKEGNLWEVAPGKSIGGDKFGNYEGLLPKGKQYYECDIDYDGGYRGDKRIVYSKDGYIYYTDDHYESFEQLYP